MPKLPDISDLGPTPTADPTRPVGSYDVSGFYRGAAAITEAGKQFGAGVQQAGEGYGELSLDESRWDYAKAHASLISGVATQNAATAQDTNIGPDDSGQTLTERHAAAVQGQQDSAADLIRDPRMRERFVSDTAPLITESNLRADAHARALDNSNSVAYVGQQGDAFINQAIAAPDDATRTGLIDAHNQLVDGLVAKGAYTPLEGQQAKQAWAHQYATADALHRADTDPQGVINELRAAPGSNDAITNRILQVEGPGKAATSSAVGGMTDGTWLSLIKQNRPDLAQGQSDQSLLAMRADKGLLRDMTEANRAGNESYLKAKGLDATPGAQYLAHFLGPAGAAAVLQAPPGTPVKDALTQAVGPDKAQQMIDANKSVLDGQLSGSVKQWADTKMGGAVPGGGSIYDMLRPDVREEVLAHAEASLQKQKVGERADFQTRVANATAEAFDMGQPSQPLTRADFIGEYGAEGGPVEFGKYDANVQSGRAVAGMATMTSQEREATVASLYPKPRDPNYATKVQAYGVADTAAAKIKLALYGDKTHPADPAGFATQRLPASTEAYSAFTAAVTNPAATPADRATAAQAYASRTLLDQQHAGLSADAARVVPNSYVDGLYRTISAAATSDDPQKRIGLMGQIQQEASMWGQYWPQVMRQLAPNSQPVVRAIAAGADPVAMTRLLSLDPKEKPAEILKEQDATKATDLNNKVDDALAPFRATMVGRQIDRDYPGYYNLASTLGALYVRDGLSADDAAEKAFNDLVGNRYDFRDSYRIPKSSAYSPDDVQAGAQAARTILAGQADAGGSEGSGLTADQVFQRNAAYIKPGATSFNTALSGGDEAKFRDWVAKNKVAFDPNEKTPDYDMRGFWQGLQSGDARAKSAIDPNDSKMHFPDYWKTPYDLTFSKESQWATPDAPSWNDRDQLVDKKGSVVFDDRAPRTPFNVKPAIDDIGLGEANGADSLRAFGRDGKWVTAPDNAGLNLAYGDKFVRTNDGAPLKLTWDQLQKLGAGRGDAMARESALAPQQIGALGSSLAGPLALTQRMGEHADMDKFERTARPSTNVEDDRNRPKSFKEKLDNAIDSASDDITTGLFK